MIEPGIARAPVERRNYTQFRIDAAVADAAGAAVRGAAFGAVAGRARAWRGFVGRDASMDDGEARRLAGLK